MDRCVVVIDDNPRELEETVTLLRKAGFNAEGFSRAKRALEYAGRVDVTVIVTEVLMPEMDGIEVLRFIQRELPHIGVVGVSGSPETLGSNYLSAMTALGAAAILSKPLDPVALVAAVNRICRKPHPHCAPGAAHE
jgi:DNA-binding NtrC family response regulator